MPDQQIIPYLYYDNATDAGEFLQSAFGFSVEFDFRDPETNDVLHATINTGNATLFVGPGMAEFGTRGTADPDHVAGMTYVFVDDVEAHYHRSIDAGATLRQELHEHFGGNRQYTVSDPGGQRWTFAQPIDDSTGQA